MYCEKGFVPLTIDKVDVGKIVLYKTKLAIIVGYEDGDVTFKWLETGRQYTHRNYTGLLSSWTVYE